MASDENNVITTTSDNVDSDSYISSSLSEESMENGKEQNGVCHVLSQSCLKLSFPFSFPLVFFVTIIHI